MSQLSSSDAKDISRDIGRLPFGITALDHTFDGIPTGSVVLLAGAPDAGVDAYAHTSIAELMVAKHRPHLHQRDVGDEQSQIPESVHYVSLINDREHVYHQLDSVLDDYQFETLTDNLTVGDFSQQFLDVLPIPGDLADVRRTDPHPETAVEQDTSVQNVLDILTDVSDHVASVGRDSVIVLDSLTDLMRAGRFGLDRRDVLGFLIGLREAAVEWGGLVYVVYRRQAGAVRADEELAGLLHGNLYFYSNDKGFQTFRTMRVGSFGGALDTNEQLVYETSVTATGLRARATKKIPPQQW